MEKTMTRKRVRLGMALAFGIMLTGCSPSTGGSASHTYTVWTDSTTYSEFSSEGGTLDDGKYIRVELSNSEFSQMSPSLTSEYKHVWTESQLYDWFIGRGFGNSEANQEKAWLITINHGIIFSRSGPIVDILMK
jgi:hypothetical protein